MSMDFETRKRFADKAGEKYKAYWLKSSRYLQQLGDSFPEYVAADPSSPVMVLLPDGEVITRTKKDGSWSHPQFKPDPHLVLVDDVHAPPAAPVAAHRPPSGFAAPVPKSHEKMGKKKADDKEP